MGKDDSRDLNGLQDSAEATVRVAGGVTPALRFGDPVRDALLPSLAPFHPTGTGGGLTPCGAQVGGDDTPYRDDVRVE